MGNIWHLYLIIISPRIIIFDLDSNAVRISLDPNAIKMFYSLKYRELFLAALGECCQPQEEFRNHEHSLRMKEFALVLTCVGVTQTKTTFLTAQNE